MHAYVSDLKMGRLKSKHKNIVTFIPIDPVSLRVCQINVPADKHVLVTKILHKIIRITYARDIRFCS